MPTKERKRGKRREKKKTRNGEVKKDAPVGMEQREVNRREEGEEEKRKTIGKA